MRKLLVALGMVLLLGHGLYAQVKTITGKVISSTDNKPVIGATITIEPTEGSKRRNTVAANNDGSFTLSIPNGNYILEVSAIGYEPREVSSEVFIHDNFTIRLTQAAKGLNEVVVVGYGTTKKKDLTGAFGIVQLGNPDKTPITGTSQMLEGTVAGVQVTQVNSQPGSTFQVRVRGFSSISSGSDPLYVVDDFPGADISTLNPSDIASIDVLKDASATAIFGSRGANGVVIITTRKGTGRNAVTFDMYTGFQQVARTLKMMNAPQFATYLDQVTTINNQNNNTNTPIPYTQAQINAMGPGTDWQKALFRNAPISNFNLALSSGNAEGHRYLSFNYFDQEGVVMNSGYKRGTIRFNMDHKAGNRIRIGFNSQASYDYQNKANINTNGGAGGGTILDALRASPIIPIKDSTGNYTYQNGPQPYVDILGNPIAAAALNWDHGWNIRLLTNAFGEWEVINGLKLRANFGGELLNYREDVFRPNTTYLGNSTNGYAAINTNNNYDWLQEYTATYDKTFGIHAINFVGGWTNQQYTYRSSNVTGNNLSSNSYGTDNLGVAASLTSTSNRSDNALVSGLARLNYRLLERYLLTFSWRADGSSRFGVNKKWGYFPSGAVAWRMSDEKFIQKVPSISDLKLRVSYGKTGNQDIGDYNSLTQYGTNTYYLDASRVVGISPNNIANPDLSWESTAQFDGGFDLGLFQNRISLTADYYNKKTTNLLYSVPLPSTSGFTNMIQNVGAVRNQGFEFMLTTVNLQSKNLRWVTTFNYSQNRSKILSLGGVPYQFVGSVSTSLFPSGGQASSILQVGQPMGSFYGYKFLGIWQSQADILKSGTKQNVRPGDPHYADLNGDSAITAADRTIIGHALPKFTYGFTSDLTVGRFNLFVLIQGVYGDNILNENKIEMENGTTADNKFAYVAQDSWVPGTTSNNRLPSVVSTLRRSLGVTSDLLEDGSYLRVKTVTLSYDLPLPTLTKVFRSASVYITGQNLLTLTHYSGFDPEVNSYGNSNTSLNSDYNPYPNIRTWLAGVRFGF
ncbi:SusC/RagA family TonB-linked outer membrane protein [Puia dinghuensis]|nr:TonB-dependent receptor [Puia dinghuensis]